MGHGSGFEAYRRDSSGEGRHTSIRSLSGSQIAMVRIKENPKLRVGLSQRIIRTCREVSITCGEHNMMHADG